MENARTQPSPHKVTRAYPRSNSRATAAESQKKLSKLLDAPLAFAGLKMCAEEGVTATITPLVVWPERNPATEGPEAWAGTPLSTSSGDIEMTRSSEIWFTPAN